MEHSKCINGKSVAINIGDQLKYNFYVRKSASVTVDVTADGGFKISAIDAASFRNFIVKDNGDVIFMISYGNKNSLWKRHLFSADAVSRTREYIKENVCKR